MRDHDENATLEDALESLKDEAREEGYQEGYLAALNDLELQCRKPAPSWLYEITDRLRRMVTSR